MGKLKARVFDILDNSEQNGIVERLFDLVIIRLIIFNRPPGGTAAAAIPPVPSAQDQSVAMDDLSRKANISAVV